MPLDNYFTKPDYSRQLKQYSGTSATFSGTTNILQAFYVKSVEIDTTGAVLSDALLFDGIKFRPAQPGGFSGSVITNGFNLSYVSGLTYRVSAGTYRFNNTIYPYIGEDFNIISGQSGGSRFDLVYISGGSVSISVRTGTTTTNPTVPNLQLGELEVGIIFVPVNFTGGTGSTIIQTTAATVFEYYNNGSGNGIQRTAVGANTQAVGSFSFAVGRDSDAYAPDSVTLGVDTKASGNSQTVVGTFNIPTTTDYFIVGYGADDSNRANAFNITNSGDTYANRKLFVTNVEIETTGATNGKVLKFNGTKFTPQLETITGATSFTGGTSIFSSITNNTLLFKSITGGSNIFLTESGGTIYVNVEFSGVTSSGVTQIESLAGGVSIISGKTGSTYFLYPLQGSGGTQVVLSDNKLVIYSDTSASTTGDNVGPIAAAGVYKEKVLNQLRFRRLSSITPSYLTIAESTGLNELILFTSTPPITGSTNATGGTVGVLGTVTNRNIIGRTLSGTNRISLSQASDVIIINSPIEVETGNAGVLSIYRSSSPVVYSSYTATNISGITIKLGTHTTPITSRTYTIPDVKKDANFVMTEGNQSINGKKDFVTGFTVGYNGNTSLEFTSYDYSNNAPNSYYFYAPKDPLYSLLIDYTTSALTSQVVNQNVPYTGTTFFGINITTYTASTGTSYSSSISWSLYDDCSCDSIDYYYTGESFNMVVSGYEQTLQTSLISYTSYTYSANTTIANSTGNIVFNAATPNGPIPDATLRAKSLLIEGVSPITFPISAFTINSGITILKTTNIGPPLIGQAGAYSGSIIGNLNRILFNSSNRTQYLTGTFVGESQEHTLGTFGGYNQKLIGTYLENYAATAFVSNTYDTVKTLAFGFRSNILGPAGSKSVFDIYIYKPLKGTLYNGFGATNGAAIYIEGKQIQHSNSREPDLYNRPTDTSGLGIVYTNAPWSLFAEGDRAYIGNTLVLASGITLSSTTRGAWLDLGASQLTRPHINFSSGTAPSTPRTGDLWFDGSILRFRLSSSTVNLTSGTSITGGSIGSSEGGGVAVYKTTLGDTLQFRSLSSSNSSYISITQVGDLIVFSGGPGVTGLSLNDLIFTSQTTNGVSLFNTIQPYQIYYKNLSAGTGIGITDNGSGLITIRNTLTGGTSGGSISGAYVSGLTPVGTGGYVILSSVTNNNLVHRTISAGTNTSITYAPDGTLVITNTGVSGNTSYTGFTDIVSAGTGDYSVISSVTNNKLVYRTLSAGTGMNITESNGTLIFTSTATGGTGSTLSGNFVPLTGTTYSSPMQGDLVFTGNTNPTNGIKAYYYDGVISTNYTFLNGVGINLGVSTSTVNHQLNISPSFNYTGTTNLSILDTQSGNGYIVTVPDIASQANKFVKVKSDQTGFDFIDNFITITYADAYNNAIDQTSNGTLTQGQWYRIDASSRGADETTDYNTYGDIFLKAISNNRFSPDGYLLAINADYQDVGDYSDVSNFNQNYGVPYNGITVGSNVSIITDIIIYNNRHWSAGMEYTLTDESSITGALTPLTKDYTTRNGYIIEPQKIVYDIVTDTINRMEDKRGNVFINNFNNYIENFRFGDNNVKQNYVSTSQPCAIINYPNLTFIDNNFKFGTIPIYIDLVPSAVTLYIQNCNIQDYFFTHYYQQTLYLSESNIQDKKIIGSQRQFIITSSTITLPMLTNAQGWLYDQGITATGGTFNGIVTAISQDNQITNYYQKFRFTNNSGSNIIFRNSTFIKTEGGLDAIITPNSADSIEFFVSAGVAYQTDINNYV